MKGKKNILFCVNRCNLWLIFLSLIFFSTLSLANSDSTKIKNKKDGTQYPLNDPRNPNCPCHQYQKLADEEFKNLQTSFSSSEKGKKVNSKKHFGQKFFYQFKKRFQRKSTRWKKPKVKTGHCFAWQ